MAVRAELIGERTGVDLDRDRALVLRYQQGDEAAFDELYTRYYPRLHLYCRRRVGDSFVAEELAQEAFLRALRAMPRFAGERRFYPWMTVIAQRLCIDHHRTASRVEPAADIDTGAVEADPGDVFTAVDRRHLEAALDRVAPRHREVLRMREQEGWSYQQIADKLSVPVTTIEALLHRARKSLKREFLAVGGGRLTSIPLFAGIAAWVGRVRTRIGGSGESSAHTGLQAATAGVAALGLAVAPFIINQDAKPSVTTTTGATTQAVQPASPDATLAAPGDPVVVEVVGSPAAAATATKPAAEAGAPEPAMDLGLVQTYQGDDAVAYWQAKQREAPIQVDLGFGVLSVDPAETVRTVRAVVEGKGS